MLWIYDTAFQVEAAAVFQSKVIINASARSLHTQAYIRKKIWYPIGPEKCGYHVTACPYTWYEIFIRPIGT